MRSTKASTAILGAAFLMATSAVGPGFLTQTTVFTTQLLASFGFVILVSVVLDIFAQLNIWRVLTVSGKRGQDVANETIPGSGYLLAGMVVFGGLVFNIGNIAGTGLGMNVLFGIPVQFGAAISAAIAITIFLIRDFGRVMDAFVKVLGLMMLLLIVYVVFTSRPPIAEAAYRTIFPATLDAAAIVTLVGGTVGGYITFAGAHRLIDAGISGVEELSRVDKSAVTGILLTTLIRFLLFLAAFGVVAMGVSIDTANPPASVFQNAAGEIGYKLFGVVMWAAAITSTVGAAFTSVSFFKTFSKRIEEKSNLIIVAFILFSTGIFLLIGRPVQVLIWAGTINGFILPIGLAIILLGARRVLDSIDYAHPKWLELAGWLVVAIMTAFSILTIFGKL
ncbi:NRAMP family divalent metal transporter [Leptolyngbya sp. 7M]|uniref:NRAMP family divalent metal transporter n=1 Tax=Leptolyngbya sp. 7M TaxID=2812896 RepID=UPI001B8D7578|nr:NRAMP family divalent metal transporter [Leptolyngbya sp. 7M]QYO66894.1 divalent metal cation transporter [Leptolyngbya sp. 7M]